MTHRQQLDEVIFWPGVIQVALTCAAFGYGVYAVTKDTIALTKAARDWLASLSSPPKLSPVQVAGARMKLARRGISTENIKSIQGGVPPMKPKNRQHKETAIAEMMMENYGWQSTKGMSRNKRERIHAQRMKDHEDMWDTERRRASTEYHEASGRRQAYHQSVIDAIKHDNKTSEKRSKARYEKEVDNVTSAINRGAKAHEAGWRWTKRRHEIEPASKSLLGKQPKSWLRRKLGV